MAGNAPRHCWHRRQPWHFGICKLQSPLEAGKFDSHSLRHPCSSIFLKLFRVRRETISLRQLATFAHVSGDGEAEYENLDEARTVIAELMALIARTMSVLSYNR